MDISIFFEPIKLQNINFSPGTIGSLTLFNNGLDFPDVSGCKIAIIGVNEDRRSIDNLGCSQAPDAVRNSLYKLYPGANHLASIIDLGNISAGHTVEDTYYALSSAISFLIKNNIMPLIIGGGQDLTYANYLAYENLEQTVNIVTIDSSFDLGPVEGDLNSRSYLSQIILHEPNYLFNYSNVGYQSYLVDQNLLELMAKLNFDAHRLGQVRDNFEEVEPVIRNADILSFDISSVRYSDAPGCKSSTPNGFYGEEACQISRYAGMSDKLTSIGFYEINPLNDINNQTAHLVSQMIWYFIDGYCNRKKDFPIGEKSDYLKYRVAIKDNKHEIIFYKSNKSDRWWMDVPFPVNKKVKYSRHHLVPCSYKDYQVACNDEMPDRWWTTYLKLS
ncbi:MAG: formimidoylglutamase [Bacteroidetes bacterium]|nr:formimidoylglutamase [Bacteroidota bacterium]HET6243247.1 formimidoylglutamase [Bacteroidia bacterium]